MIKIIVMTCVGLGCVALGTPALAQNATAGSTAAPVAISASSAAATPANHGIKPGDRLCLQQTGSLIRAKKGTCLPVAGRSYSAADLQRVGTPDTARALERLDPSVRLGH
ncbi:MAG: hypothetical protein ABI114_13235 [Rhodanobacter sp.]